MRPHRKASACSRLRRTCLPDGVRFAEGSYARFPELAAELARLDPDVIVTGTTAAIRSLQRATTTIPIVLAYSTDPVGNGFVASLARPGGNITGLSRSSEDTSPKQLELVATIVPNATRIGMLGNRATPTYADVRKAAQNAAEKVGLTLVPIRRERACGFAHLGLDGPVVGVCAASRPLLFG